MQGQFDLAPTEWATLRRLLGDALDRPAAERATWVEQLDTQFDVFKPRLRALLEHAARATGALPLDTLPKIETAQFLDGRRPGEQGLRAGAKVGPYELIRRLGEGGMGEVWLAERTDILQRRQVALKLPRLVTGRAEFGERLEREREILAALEHPNIARLYDAGLTADGQPYLALEYVEGERIDAYCKRKALDVPARQRLFLQVARAVAHAHSRLVVHRDLKPANILVTESGEVRLLDFGIAKLLEDGRAQETELTQLAGRALTPDYAAPEQILGQPIGTAADIYALGVVLFELLTGSRPYQLKRESRAALEEAIVQADVPRPSSLVTDAKLKQRLRGDLDTIVLKALKKSPAERYGTVEALADDIERHLQRRPVLAQPDSRLYRLSRFVARNQLAVGASAMVLLAIVAGAGVALWQMQMARSEQQRAESVKDFIASVMRDSNPYQNSSDRPVTAVDLLRRAEHRIDRELGAQPAVRAELLRILGASYAGLFDHARAEAVLARALAATEQSARESDALLIADLQVQLGEIKKLLGKRDEAKALLATALGSLDRKGLTQTDPYIDARLLEAGIAIDEGDPQRIESAAKSALAVSTALHGEINARTAGAYGLLVRAYGMQRKLDLNVAAAEKSYRLLLALHDNNPMHPEVMEAQHTYGAALIDQGQFDAALVHVQQSLENAVAVYGERNMMSAHFRARLGLLQMFRGELAVGLSTLQDAQRFLAGTDQTRNFAAAGRLRAIGRGLIWLQRPQQALQPLGEAIAILDESRNERATLITQADYANALIQLGRLDEADQLLATVTRRGKALDPPEVPHQALARLHLARGEAGLAQPLLEAALTPARADLKHVFLPEILSDLGFAALEQHAFAEAESRFREALDVLDAKQKTLTPVRANIWLGRGRSYLGLARASDAAPLLRQADAFWRDFAPDNRSAGETAFWLGECYSALGGSKDTKPLYSRAEKILARSPFPGDAKLVALARGR